MTKNAYLLHLLQLYNLWICIIMFYSLVITILMTTRIYANHSQKIFFYFFFIKCFSGNVSGWNSVIAGSFSEKFSLLLSAVQTLFKYFFQFLFNMIEIEVMAKSCHYFLGLHLTGKLLLCDVITERREIQWKFLHNSCCL